MTSNAIGYAKSNEERFRKELHDLLRIPSISTDPAYKNEVRRAAEWLVEHFKNLDFDVELIETEKHPLVYAEWIDAENVNKPTVLVYGHYDVQPAKLEDGWDTEPFEPVEKDGKIYARGATDDKGQLFIHIKAVESMLVGGWALPVNVKFILEGEEESGGVSIEKYVATHHDKLKADVCLISDGSMAGIDQPLLVSGLRGNVAMDLIIEGPKSDLHSGTYGGSVHNPAQALAELISKMHDDNGRVTIPGFYDDVVILTHEERDALAELKYSLEKWQSETGAPQPWGEAEYSIKERTGIRPTLEINGMAGGYFDAGFKTIVPQKAWAKISCRLVANQNPRKIFSLIEQFVKENVPPTVTYKLNYIHGGLPAQMDIHDPMMQAAVRAYEIGWGHSPKFAREGGSIPIVAGFQDKLNIPIVLMGFGLNTDNLHAPNEHYSIEMFHRGIDTSIHFFHQCAKIEVNS